jgi:MSHA biogenesis protein MshP
MNVRQTAQGGFAAIAAIFLVVVLAALGGFMLTFSSSQQLTSAQDVQGSRAYWAARAGLEWAVVAIPPTGLATLNACTITAPPVAIDGFTIAIVCTKATYADTGTTTGVSPTAIFRITVTASTGTVGSIAYVDRSVTASVEQ